MAVCILPLLLLSTAISTSTGGELRPGFHRQPQLRGPGLLRWYLPLSQSLPLPLAQHCPPLAAVMARVHFCALTVYAGVMSCALAVHCVRLGHDSSRREEVGAQLQWHRRQCQVQGHLRAEEQGDVWRAAAAAAAGSLPTCRHPWQCCGSKALEETEDVALALLAIHRTLGRAKRCMEMHQ